MRLENYEQIYDEVERRKQSRRFALGFSALLRCVYAPNVIYMDGAKEGISEAINEGKTNIFAIGHRSLHDPNVAQAAVYREPLLRRRVGSINVWAKSPLFVSEKRFDPTPLLTWEMGGIPVFRKKDYPDASPEMLRAVGDRMTDATIAALQRGEDLAVFPEGTCNEGDPTQLLMINTGLAHVMHQTYDAQREDDPEAEPQFTLIPVGISYGVNPQPDFWRARRATVAFGSPIDTLERKPFQTTKVIKLGMEAVLAVAHEDYHARRGEDVPVWKDETDTLIT